MVSTYRVPMAPSSITWIFKVFRFCAGPQGTLFGKNTTGGAILYATNKPMEEYGGHASVRVGNYDKLDSQATVNIPIIGETLMSRFSLYQTKNDGYVQSEIPDDLPEQAEGNPPFLEDEFNDTDRWGGQAQFRWVALDELILDLNYNYTKTDQAARGQNCEVVEGIEGAGWQSDLQDATVVGPSTGQFIKGLVQGEPGPRQRQDHGQPDAQPVQGRDQHDLGLTGRLGYQRRTQLQEHLVLARHRGWRGQRTGCPGHCQPGSYELRVEWRRRAQYRCLQPGVPVDRRRLRRPPQLRGGSVRLSRGN